MIEPYGKWWSRLQFTLLFLVMTVVVHSLFGWFQGWLKPSDPYKEPEGRAAQGVPFRSRRRSGYVARRPAPPVLLVWRVGGLPSAMRKWIQAYLDKLAEEGRLSAHTRAGYGSDLLDFADAMESAGAASPSALQPYHVQAYLRKLQQEGKSPATAARRLASIRRLCRHGVIENILDRDPTLQLETPKTEKRIPAALSREEADKLLAAPDGNTAQGLRDQAMLEVLYASGMRVSELLALDAPDVRAELGFLRCAAPGGKERFVPIGAPAIQALNRYLERGRPALLRPDKPTDALFPNHLGTRMTRQGFWKAMKKHARAAGLQTELTPQTLRRSFAIHLLENGADLRAVQEMLGHATAQATQRYQNAARAKVKEEYDRAHPRARS